MIFIDTNGFDRQHYKFDYVRREFLGECAAWCRRDADGEEQRAGDSWAHLG